MSAVSLLQGPAPHLTHLYLEPLLACGELLLALGEPLLACGESLLACGELLLLCSQVVYRLDELIHAVGKVGYRLGQLPHQGGQGQEFLGGEERAQFLPPVGVFPEEANQILKVLQLKRHE
jgi:hypothetical protein